MLGVCQKLSESLGLDKTIIQIIFLIWFLHSGGTALLIYFLLYLFL